MKKKEVLMIVFNALLLVLTIVLSYLSINLDIFKSSYVFAGLALTWVLDFIAICASIHYYKKINILGKIIAVLMAFVVLSSTIFVYSLNTNLKSMKANQDLVLYALYLNDEPSPTDIGFLELGNRIHDESIRIVIRNAYPELNIKAYDSIETLHRDLASAKLDGFLCLDTYFDVLEAYDKSYALADNYEAAIKYRYEDKRNIKSEEFPGLYTVILTSNYSDLSVKELAYSPMNKLLLINPDNHKLGIVNIPSDYFVKQACLNQRYDLVANSSIYSLSCAYLSLANHFNTNIDFYLKLNLEKMIELIDHLGGLEIDNPSVAVSDNETYAAGRIKLNAKECLDYINIDDELKSTREIIVIERAIEAIHSLSILKYVDYLDEIFDTNLDNDKLKSLLNEEYTISQLDINGKYDSDYSYSMGLRMDVRYPMSSDVERFKEFEYQILN